MKDMVAYWNGSETMSIQGRQVTVERRQLAQWVLQTDGNPQWTNRRFGSSSIPAPVLRSVVLYCVALNICGADEIVEASESVAAVEYLCAHHSLDWQTVHEFRKRHVFPLRDSLAAIFSAVLSAAPAVISPRRAGLLEAGARIRRAVQADSILLDL